MRDGKNFRRLKWSAGVLAIALLFSACGGSGEGENGGAKFSIPVFPTQTIQHKEKAEMSVTLELPTGAAYDATLKKVISDAGDKVTQLIMPLGNYQITEDLTIPENIQLTIQKGACFTVSAGKTLTIKGWIDAEASYIFRGEGTVAGPIQGEGYVQWFGADEMPDDQTKAFQRAIDACKVVLVPNRTGGYKFQYLTFKNPVEMKGVGTNRVTMNAVVSSSNDFFIIQSSDVIIRNITMECKLPGTSTSNKMGIYLDTAKGSYENILLENIYINDPGFGIGDSLSKENTVKNLMLDEFIVDRNHNIGVYLTNASTGIILRDVVVNSFSPNIGSKGYVFENVEEMYLENVDVLGGFEKSQDTGDGMTFLDCKNVSCYRIMIDYVSGKQLVMKNCSNFYFSNFISSLVKLEGIYMENVTDSVIDVMKTNGTYNTSDPTMVMKDCSGNTFYDLIVQCSQTDGLVMTNCTNNTFNNLIVSETLGKAIVETGGSGNVFNGLSCRENGGGISLTGKNTINGYLKTDGTSVATITGAYSD